jgi:hypothetical protein
MEDIDFLVQLQNNRELKQALHNMAQFHAKTVPETKA